MSKKLGLFQHFEADKFLKDKTLLALAVEPFVNDDKIQIGYKVTVVVYDDSTDYGDADVTNAGDSYKVKIQNMQMNQFELPEMVKLVKPTGTVYGDYREKLSLSAENIVSLEK